MTASEDPFIFNATALAVGFVTDAMVIQWLTDHATKWWALNGTVSYNDRTRRTVTLITASFSHEEDVTFFLLRWNQAG